MKVLGIAFWSIVVATGLRLCLCMGIFAPRVILLVFSARVWLACIHPIGNLLFYITPLYSLAIGYILWLFHERKRLVWGSYAYIIGFVLYTLFFRHRIPETHLSPMYWLSALCTDIPNAICGICWLRVRVRPMAPYYWALGGIYLVLLSLTFACSTLFLYTQLHPWNRAIYLLSVLIPLPTLFLIARARREWREREALEREVLAI